MKDRKIKRLIAMLLTFVMFVSSLSAFSLSAAAADKFENQISDFPESYKVYLRDLHKKYPNWVFQAVDTDINWSDAVANENIGERSLITSSAGDVFKSKESGDYNLSTDKYTQYDAGFVRANAQAVGYFMDPRNFLNESGIFQFEQLSFSSDITVDVVEQVLKGSFMSNKKITYLDKNGKEKTINIKYSQAIYNAGNKYNVNPCYLASKIINEVGVNGSDSTSGKYSGYEGYYNFYNIGATSSSTPIKNGLEYAKGGKNNSTTYQRPWTDPQKAIMGGAEFIASGYISKGQDTGYFQRFNVSPNAVSATYTHQYMTDISGAYFQSNTTYNTYNSLSMMGLKRVFKIPVYRNMLGAASQATSFSLKDSAGQTGTVNVSSLNVRSQPNTGSAKIAGVPSGTKVKILSKVMNSSGKYNFLSYPYWYQISFSLNGDSYTGYVCSEYIDISSEKTITMGNTFNLSYNINSSEKPSFISNDTSVVKVNSNGSLTALKAGRTTVGAYTSKGLYDEIKICVTDGIRQVGGLYVSNKTTGSVTLSWNKVDSAEGYEVYKTDSSGKYQKITTVTSTSYTISNLKAGESFKCKVRAYGKVGGVMKYGELSSAVNCLTYYKTLSKLKQSAATKNSITLKWSEVDNATAYDIYAYNSSSGKYERIKQVKDNSYTVTGLNSATAYKYEVVAKVKVNGNSVDYAGSRITAKTAPKAPSGLKISDTTSTTVTLKWSAVKGASKYAVYKLQSNGKYSKIATVKTTSYKDSGLSSKTKVSYKVKAIVTSNGNSFYGSYSSSISASTGPAKVKNVKVSSVTTNTAVLKWSKSTSASGYYIYRYDSSAKKYVYVGKTKNTSYTLKNLTSGSNVSYVVRAYLKTDGKTYKGSNSSKVSVRTLPDKVTGLKFSSPDKNSYTLTWNTVRGATGYEIYKLQSNGTYKKLTSVTTNSYKVQKQKSATAVTYKVKAYIKNGDKNIYGEMSDKLKATTLPKNVSSLKSTKSGKSYTLSWSKSTRADGYMIYVYNSSSKKYEYVGMTSSTKFTVEPKVSTKYKVMSYVKCNGKRYKASGKTVSITI